MDGRVKGISYRVNEVILHREVQNIFRDSDTIVY